MAAGNLYKCVIDLEHEGCGIGDIIGMSFQDAVLPSREGSVHHNP